MPINSRTKGQTGEREIATTLNEILDRIRISRGFPIPSVPQVQRNQNQTAVGGCDLIGTFDLAIEIKRQEQLSVNTWWKQTVKSAEALYQKPVLIYRQNRKGWRVRMNVAILVNEETHMSAIGEVEWEDFLEWFEHYAGEQM